MRPATRRRQLNVGGSESSSPVSRFLSHRSVHPRTASRRHSKSSSTTGASPRLSPRSANGKGAASACENDDDDDEEQLQGHRRSPRQRPHPHRHDEAALPSSSRGLHPIPPEQPSPQRKPVRHHQHRHRTSSTDVIGDGSSGDEGLHRQHLLGLNAMSPPHSASGLLQSLTQSSPNLMTGHTLSSAVAKDDLSSGRSSPSSRTRIVAFDDGTRGATSSPPIGLDSNVDTSVRMDRANTAPASKLLVAMATSILSALCSFGLRDECIHVGGSSFCR